MSAGPLLEAAATRVGPAMDSAAVANTMWAYATLGRAPEGGARVALEAATARVGPLLEPQHVANLAGGVLRTCARRGLEHDLPPE